MRFYTKKREPLFLFIMLCFLFCNEQNKPPYLKGDYLGQTPPGGTPQIFAPDFISTGMNERCIAVTLEGKEIFYNIILNRIHYIVTTKQVNNTWTPPEVASFSGKYSDVEPFIHPDGSKLYFSPRSV